MASLNPNAPVYIPYPHLLSLESYHSPPLPQNPSLSPPLYFQYNQTPYQNNALYASSPFPYMHDLCYYLTPQTSFVCFYRKEFPYLQIPQPCPPRPLPHPLPLPLPPSGLQQPRASFSLLIEEGVENDKPQGHVVSAIQEKQEVEETVVREKFCKGVKVSKGFRVFASGSFTGKRVYLPKPLRRRGRLPPLLRRRRLTGDYEFKKVEPPVAGHSNSDAKTTVMIKNLPNKFTMEKLLGILDKHCLRENEKVLSFKGEEKACDGVVKLGDRQGATTLSEFDFLYLPIDFRSGSNLGYAFVNFTSSTAAWRLHDYLHHFEWKCFGSRKICEVTYARIQELKNHFTDSVFLCDWDQYLPMCFQPSRNGFNQPEPEYVGGRIHVASKAMK